jgi:prolyl 4-hydroxylase
MISIPFRFADSPLLWTVEDVYSAAECRAIVERIERSAPALATNNPIYRDQDRVMEDDPGIASDLFTRLRPHLPANMGSLRLIGLNERLRFYRYRPGQRFLPHMDHWFKRSPTQITLHTVLVYFNDDFEGGETQFYEQLEAVVTPKPGMVAVFQHKLRHEGCEVRTGAKYALRTDTLYEAPEPVRIEREGA